MLNACPPAQVEQCFLLYIRTYLNVCSLFTVVTDTYCAYVRMYSLCLHLNTLVGLKAAPGSWDRWPVLASLPLLRAAEADQESERAQRQVASARQGVCCVSAECGCGCGYGYVCTVCTYIGISVETQYVVFMYVRTYVLLVALCSGRVCMTTCVSSYVLGVLE